MATEYIRLGVSGWLAALTCCAVAMTGLLARPDYAFAIDSGSQRRMETTEGAPDKRCEINNFTAFLNGFIKDSKFQCVKTRFPLKITTISPNDFPDRGLLDDDSSYYVKIVKFNYNSDCYVKIEHFYPVPENNVAIKCFPYAKLLNMTDVFYHFSDSSMQKIKFVNFKKEGTGISVSLKFIWDGCWFLTEITDYST